MDFNFTKMFSSLEYWLSNRVHGFCFLINPHFLTPEWDDLNKISKFQLQHFGRRIDSMNEKTFHGLPVKTWKKLNEMAQGFELFSSFSFIHLNYMESIFSAISFTLPKNKFEWNPPVKRRKTFLLFDSCADCALKKEKKKSYSTYYWHSINEKR